MRTTAFPALPLLVGLAAAACGTPPAKLVPPPPVSPAIAIVGATLWDGTGRAPVANAVTVVRGERILCAGGAGECPIPRGARVIEGQGQYLIPGLIDSHVHLLFLSNGSAGEELGRDLRDLLAQGVTTVRDMGNSPGALLSRVAGFDAAPRVYAMQLVAGRRFFFNGIRPVQTARGVVYRQAPALTMQWLGWTPMQFNREDDADAVVAEARKVGAMGLKLYAQLDSGSVRRLTDAAHRAGLTVWGHAWVQPSSVGEESAAGMDGVVHAAGLAGELFSPEERDTLVNDGDLQAATAKVATPVSAHDPRVLATLDSMAARGTLFEPTLDATRHSLATYDARIRHVPSVQEGYVRAASQFGVEVTREAIKRGVRISAGSDHVAYGPVGERSSLFGELQLLVDSIALSPTAALLAATRDAARAIGGEPARRIGTIEAGRYADLVMLSQDPLENIGNLESVEWVMRGGRVFRPGQLRSGIAMR
ncbi:MAG TPA: amidohydrolase family protein [Gemmatimonadales bacterium]|nr:amidohydrolase family protein [Gemmatimonadales bacterium]